MARPTAIEVREVWKSFWIPEPNAAGNARLRHLLRRRRGRPLEVLRDISFEIEQGEFFGVIGRNGSGKTTLLKLLASIYRPQRGRIRLAGRLAPFLELGVGFNPELPAYDNIVLNGVMMGLRPAQARERYPDILDFAGLTDYADLKLKNYSSGMKVRLGFSVMTHVDADVLLIDEVLAVGDAEFQEKCGEVFRQMHDEGRTIVLVTHDMAAVSTYCDRALLLHGGEIAALGEPDAVTDEYLRVNREAFASEDDKGRGRFLGTVAAAVADPSARIADLWLTTAPGQRTVSVAQGTDIELHIAAELDAGLGEARLYLDIDNALGRNIFIAGDDELGVEIDRRSIEGGSPTFTARIENRLAPGRYLVRCAILRRASDGSLEMAGPGRTLRMDVPGDGLGGLVLLDYEVDEAVPAVEVRPT